MQQYFIQGELNKDITVSFNHEQRHHIKDVLRMREGTVVRIVNELGHAAFACVSYVDKEVIGVIQKLDSEINEMKCKVTLCMGLIKKEKWDYFLQKATELGVYEIVPFESIRTVVKSKDEKVGKKLERWNKIVSEACEQSKRNYIPKILEPIPFVDLIHNKSELNCIAYEDAKITGEKFKSLLNDQKSVTLVIGPEGGFDESEVSYLLENGFHCISLGKRILRAETAATYGLSVIDALSE